MAVVEQPLHRALGLTDDELERIVRDARSRARTATSSRCTARCGPSTAPTSPRRSTCARSPPRARPCWSGPGQDAGAVDVGDGFAVVFKMESHSHPSAIEPYQGAATGVGGIVRDIISMGARPVALLDPLMFGPLTDERNRWLLGGVVAGIGGYGNCIGVPTVGGEIHFAEPHSANPSVNVMCVGIAPCRRAHDLGVARGPRGILHGALRGVDRTRRDRRGVRARERHHRGGFAGRRGRPCRSAIRSRGSS